MKVTIANPIYDTVFKYLMEDDRVVKVLLSALLKKNVVRTERRRHEYSNTNRDEISYFRIDFAATVEDEDGKQSLMLIELQKTWLPSETYRFRQYLGQQYANKENIKKDDNGNNVGIPMVAVYLLGHCVGNIEAPILYVNHRYEDYDGNEVKKGLPDPFVDSLKHESIIVQIPLLHGHVSNRLEEILHIFDQTYVSKTSMQTLQIDDSEYTEDADMQYVIKKLIMASASAEVRRQMDVEEEFFSEIDSRDAELNKVKAEKKAMGMRIDEQKKEIDSQKQEISSQKQKLDSQKLEIEQKDNTIRSMALSMLNVGMPLEQIAKITNMSEEELRDLVR